MTSADYGVDGHKHTHAYKLLGFDGFLVKQSIVKIILAAYCDGTSRALADVFKTIYGVIQANPVGFNRKQFVALDVFQMQLLHIFPESSDQLS